jgi:hypothetical protein
MKPGEVGGGRGRVERGGARRFNSIRLGSVTTMSKAAL